jgi:hypothetical protein
MAGLTVTLAGDWLSSIGSKRASTGTITFDDSYPTGGESLTPAMIGLGVIDSIHFNHGEDGYVFKYVHSTQKIMVFRTLAAGTISKPTFSVQASGAIGTDMGIGLSADAASATVEGAVGISAERVLTTTSPVGTPTLTGTAGALVEVTAAVDLSAVVVEFMATGR